MKKKIVLVVMALLSFSLFAKEIKTVQRKEQDIVKQFESKVFNVHYKIIKHNNGQAMLSITDVGLDALEVRIFTDTINDAFDWYFNIEGELLDSYIEGRKDETLFNIVNENPLFFMIVSFYDDDYEWKEDLATGNYYYEIDDDFFDFPSYYDTEDYEDFFD